MDVVEILRDFALAADAIWLKTPDGERKDTMRELGDALREAANAKLQARQPKGAPPVRSLAVHVIEDPEEF